METEARRHPWWRRREVVLAFFICAALVLGYWLERHQRVEVAPGLQASTQQETESGLSHPDFRGDWKIDLNASDSFAPILRAAGQSEWKIRLVARVASTHIIRGDQHRLTLLVKTPVLDQKQELLLDGTPSPAMTPDGGETLASTRWSEDGQSLITTTQPSGSHALAFRITRSLAADRRTMFLDLECQDRDGNPIRVRRVYRLIALAS